MFLHADSDVSDQTVLGNVENIIYPSIIEMEHTSAISAKFTSVVRARD